MIAPVSMANARQVAAIRTLQKRVGMDDDAYRAFLDGQAGVRSTKLLTAGDAGRVIDALKELAGQAPALMPADGGQSSQVMPADGTGQTSVRSLAQAKGAVAGLDTAVGRKLRALWISGWNLGLVRDRTDRAMLVFLERQTGVSHVRFLAPEHAHRAIEALKSWLGRAGVAWPNETHPPPLAGEGGHAQHSGGGVIAAHKRAVIDAQWRRLADIGVVRPLQGETLADGLDRYAFKVTWKNGWCFFESHDYDAVMAALGRKLRAALADQAGGVT